MPHHRAGWCINVMRSQIVPMKDVAAMIRKHFDGIVAWTHTCRSNGFIEAVMDCSKLPSAKRADTPASTP
jgi:hypothetical protein